MQINIHEAKTHFSRFVARAANGEEIIIARDGKPLAKLVALDKEPAKERVPGLLKGKLVIADDAFAPLTEEELRDW